MAGRDRAFDPTALDAAVIAGRSHVLSAIAWGTLIAGTLDICAAMLTWLLRGVSPGRVLQSVAAGLVGRDSFSGGVATAALGLLLHFTIMSGIVTVFVLASRHWRMLIARTLPAAIARGIAYGVAVYLIMTYVVVPLSASPGRAPSLSQFIQGVTVHILCVGVPIALITRRVLHRES